MIPPAGGRNTRTKGVPWFGTALALYSGVTAVAQVLAGVVYALARRATRRTFLFRPDKSGKMQESLLYCVAVAAERHGVDVHALTAVSNHFHPVVTDVRGELPEFLQYCHRLIANATKCHRGWPEEVFSRAGTSKVVLCSPEAMVAQIAYAIVNPVACGAVRCARDWPGVQVMPEDIGVKVFRIPRPAAYFDPNNGQWPEVAELRITMPKMLLEAYGLKGAQERIAARVAELEQAAHDKARRDGTGFGTPHSAMECKFTRRANSWEPFGALNPRFAAAGNRDAARDAVVRMRAFREAYGDCMRRWRAGERDMLWPAGTWKMRVVHGVRCRPPP